MQKNDRYKLLVDLPDCGGNKVPAGEIVEYDPSTDEYVTEDGLDLFQTHTVEEYPEWFMKLN